MADENPTGVSELDLERPLSPVLSNKDTRRYLQNKKRQRKSCVKLTERFSDDISSKLKANKSYDLEKTLLRCSSSDASSEHIEEESVVRDIEIPDKNNTVNNLEAGKPELNQNILSTCKTKSTEEGFKTANGKNINLKLSDDMLKKSKNLFDDILNCSEHNVSRPNKYSFLSKNDQGNCVKEQKKVLNEKENILKDTFKLDIDPLPNPKIELGGFGFQKASGKNLLMSDSAYKTACRFLLESEPSCSEIVDVKNINRSNQELDLLSSQDSNQLLSNLTIIESSHIHQSVPVTIDESNFKGFTVDVIRESKNYLTEFSRALSQLSQKNITNSFCNSEPTSVFNNNIKRPTTSPELFKNDIKFTNKKQKLENVGGFTTAAGNKYSLSNAALAKAQQTFENFDLPSLDNKLYENFNNNSLASNKDSIPECALKERTVKESCKYSFQTGAGTSLNLSESALKKAQQMLCTDDDLSVNNLSWADETSTLTGKISFEDSKSSPKPQTTSSVKKKRLGVSCRKKIVISEQNIEKAKKLFDDEMPSVMSPLRTTISGVYNSTPLKNTSFTRITSDITPIKVRSKIPEMNIMDNRFVIHECTKGDIRSWYSVLASEKLILEKKLQVICEKQNRLDLQSQILENRHEHKEKQQTGILYNRKHNKDRVPLQNLKIDTSSMGRLNVTPQNAEFVHFNYAEQNLSSVATLDGANIVPNINHEVGVSEITIAFKVMPGVDPNLIPEGWIKNHFKWIVWKLTSYENFSINLKNCLTLENVVQQLKYRYDREIDRAERSTLRKIFELDDIPQKRMVLCVSNIFTLDSGKFELELTDGWYSIRAIIDDVLCQQVTRRKVQIGTKLITYGAELLNCEGCHPLQCTDLVRLRINSNSTRRTKWFVKLGYQRCPEPFPIKFMSVLPNGGLIGCIKIFVARVYPVKYLERHAKSNVWRNRKAEELYSQEWENKIQQEILNVKEKVTKDYEMRRQNKSQKANVNSIHDIRNIDCPETLFTLYQNSKDPERFQELLSLTQKNSINDYQLRISRMQEQEISRKIQDTINNLKSNKRNVTTLFQLRVVDILDPDKRTHILQIWRPSEMHFEIIKESLSFSVYNVVPKKNGDFSTMNRTKFQVIQNEFPHLLKFKRSLTRISDVDSVRKSFFNEFDTVGIVVALKIDSFSQFLWLSDPSGRLLFIKIFDGPKNCILLDNLTVGRIVAVSNLIYSQSKLEFGEAIANHLTTISCYPQQKHLQEGIDLLNKELPKNLKIFLNECEQKISYYVHTVGFRTESTSSTLVQSHSLITSDIFDESSDALFSMIDLDKFK